MFHKNAGERETYPLVQKGAYKFGRYDREIAPKQNMNLQRENPSADGVQISELVAYEIRQYFVVFVYQLIINSKKKHF